MTQLEDEGLQCQKIYALWWRYATSLPIKKEEKEETMDHCHGFIISVLKYVHE